VDGKAVDNVRSVDRKPYEVRLPGFVTTEPLGLGDVLKGATSILGIRPCGGCERRAQALNRKMIFTGRRSE